MCFIKVFLSIKLNSQLTALTSDCFSKIGNKADDYTIAFLKAKSNKLYKQYYNEADKVTKACKKKYFDDGSPFARAEYHQCYMDRMLYLGEKYDRIINGR